MKCKNFTIRTKKGIKYNYCKLHKTTPPCYGCKDKEYKQYKALSNRSKKQSKKERQRFSIIYPNLDKCCVCGSKWLLTTHEIFGGRNRSNSMKYGLCLPLCLTCHEKYQNNKSFNDKWHSIGQTKFEEVYPELDFIKIFGKNYKKNN